MSSLFQQVLDSYDGSAFAKFGFGKSVSSVMDSQHFIVFPNNISTTRHATTRNITAFPEKDDDPNPTGNSDQKAGLASIAESAVNEISNEDEMKIRDAAETVKRGDLGSIPSIILPSTPDMPFVCSPVTEIVGKRKVVGAIKNSFEKLPDTISPNKNAPFVCLPMASGIAPILGSVLMVGIPRMMETLREKAKESKLKEEGRFI